MTLTAAVSQAELQRVAEDAYEGRRVRVSLALLGASGFTVNSTRVQWDSIKLSGSGYADFTDVVEVGAYDVSDARYEMGGTAGANTYFTATFTPSGTITFDRIYCVIGTSDGGGGWIEEASISHLISESDPVVLSAGVPRTYRIQLFTKA
jgi:hypothetical protein